MMALERAGEYSHRAVDGIKSSIRSLHKKEAIISGAKAAGIGIGVFVAYKSLTNVDFTPVQDLASGISRNITPIVEKGSMPSISGGLVYDRAETAEAGEQDLKFAEVNIINLKTGTISKDSIKFADLTVVSSISPENPQAQFEASPSMPESDRRRVRIHLGFGRPSGTLVDIVNSHPFKAEARLFSAETKKLTDIKETTMEDELRDVKYLDRSTTQYTLPIGEPYNEIITINWNPKVCPFGPDLQIDLEIDDSTGEVQIRFSTLNSTRTNLYVEHEGLPPTRVPRFEDHTTTVRSGVGFYNVPEVRPDAKCIDFNSKGTAIEPSVPGSSKVH